MEDLREMTKEQLIKEVNSQKEEIDYLEHLFIDGVMAEDFGHTLYPENDFAKEDIYSKEELSDSELRKNIHDSIRRDGFVLHDWALSITDQEYSDESIKLMKTIVSRDVKLNN